ncbi:MAG: hypothetical protein JO132_13140 [Streptosporangiaceae bacterium]|nr:hypothetical protein [Streptosporangiaceae bacterium]
MPKRVRPYGSADDTEAAALARTRPRGELLSETASMMTAREIAEAVCALDELASDGADHAGLDDVRDVIAGLERMSEKLPRLCEQLARILVVQREDGQVTRGSGQDPDSCVVEAVEALAAAGQASDMMTTALAQAAAASAKLRSPRSGMADS